MLYDADAIMHVGEAGLEYVDEYDGVCFINFELCGHNAIVQLQNPAALGCVAHRIFTIDSSGRIERIVEFFTHPQRDFHSTRMRTSSDCAFRSSKWAGV